MAHLSKRERRHLRRTLSPQQTTEDGGIVGTPKANKKLKKVQRGKDRDDKTAARPRLEPDIPRAGSIDVKRVVERDYIDFVAHRDVTESLNPSLQRRGSDLDFCRHGRERLRRANSATHIVLGPGNVRRCPPERKQFYRQFMKSIKFYGISSTTANRMETPAPSHLPRHHSANLSTLNPYGQKMEKLWYELQAYLRDNTPDFYEEWLFFNQRNVDKVLGKIIHYSCSSVDCTQSLTTAKFPSRAGYEPLHNSLSTPSFHSSPKLGGNGNGGGGGGSRIWADPFFGMKGTPENTGDVGVVNGGGAPATPQGNGVQVCVDQDNQSECLTPDQEAPESSSCGVEHQDFLSLLQQRAVEEVDALLCELDLVEGLFMDRRHLGDNHTTYRTKFFKRRVSALNLYQKVMHGLAENLCHLSNWLGVGVLLPDICLDSPCFPATTTTVTPSDSTATIVETNNTLHPPPSPSPSSVRRDPPPPSSPSRKDPPPLSPSTYHPPLSPSSTRRDHPSLSPSSTRRDHPSLSPSSTISVRLADSSLCTVSEKPLSCSPLAVSQLQPRFKVGSPGTEEEDNGTVTMSRSSLTASCATDSLPLYRLESQESRREPYKEFVSRALKREGITFTVKRLKEFIAPIVRLAKYALTVQRDDKDAELNEEFSEEERKPLLANAQRFMSPGVFGAIQQELPPHLFSRSTSLEPQNWNEEFRGMNLPPFSMQYIQLVHVPLDVMRECLRLQVELDKDLHSPSPHTIKQLADECREILKHAVDVRDAYRQDISAILESNPSKADQVEADLEGFENNMKNVLKVYFRYLKTWVNLSSGHILEEEWRNVKKICTSIRGGEAEAGRKFCDMVTELLECMGDDLDQKMDEICLMISRQISERTEVEPRDLLTQSSRQFKELFVGIRERANRVLGFAKILRKDLEIAADFRITTNIPELFGILKASDHVRVVLPHQKLEKMMFVPEGTSENVEEIQQLLNVSFAHGSSEEHHFGLKGESYILLVNVDVAESQSAWSGKTVNIQASAETTINLSELQVDSLKMVVANSSLLNESRNSFLSAVGKAVSLTCERTSSHENVAERIKDFKGAACEMANRLMKSGSKVMEYLSMEDIAKVDDHNSMYQSAMHACFNLGFEYVREVFRLLGEDLAYQELGPQALDYAIVWIRFVLDKSERGRGTRPRWASTGLEFLAVACAPTILASLSNSRFENVKKLMNKCVDHVVGEAPLTTVSLRQVQDYSVSRMGMQNKKPWIKPRKLPFGALGFSFTGNAHLEDQEDTTSVYKLPHTKFHEGRVCDGMDGDGGDLGCVRIEEPPTVANYDPSRLEMAAHIYEGGVGTDALDCESPGHVRLYPRQQSPLPTIPSKSPPKSPPTSTDSLEHAYNSSGVDSPLNQSTSDLSSTANYPPRYPSSPPRQPLHVTMPPSAQNSVEASPQDRHSLLIATPSSVDRMDSSTSSTSTGSATQYYSLFQRSPSVGTPNSLGRSDSGSSTESCDRSRRIQERIKLLEINREKTLRSEKWIGHVSKLQSSQRKVANLTNLLQTNFKWQKGRMLGEGRFGKVFECLNLTTGEINAVKQISIREKDTGAIQAIIDEISNFQRLRNDYVVKFYGVEVHHNELYMFMEYCNEGTLWTIAQQGLTEDITRHYTRDILKAVDKMHASGIVHRDIKGANIFLSSNGSIKLGDFGLSVQLKNYNKTMPNEIKQEAGTVPYMAPEVILRRDMGRPMDIWSVGCVVLEMATGKLPWSEYDNQYTIMLQLGHGTHPKIPKSALSHEGHQFLDKCFIVDVQKRPTALDLLSDPFVKVSD